MVVFYYISLQYQLCNFYLKILFQAQVPFLRSTFWRGGRGAYRGGAKLGTGRPPYNATSVDRRPTKLLVTGFDKDEADHVVEHFKVCHVYIIL